MGPFPAPYRYSVTYVERGDYAEPVGFDQPKIMDSDYEDIIRTINEATGKLVAYDRAPFHRVTQINPKLTKGRIVMHKHHVSEAHKNDGTIDQTAALIGTLDACVSVLKGELKLVSMAQEQDAHNPKRMHFKFTADAA